MAYIFASLVIINNLLLFLFPIIISLIWVYYDASNRGKNGFLIAFIVLILYWPLSILAWLFFRPAEKPLSMLEQEKV